MDYIPTKSGLWHSVSLQSFKVTQQWHNIQSNNEILKGMMVIVFFFHFEKTLKQVDALLTMYNVLYICCKWCLCAGQETQTAFIFVTQNKFLFFSTQCFQKCIHQLDMGHTCNRLVFPFQIKRLNQCYSVNCMKMLAFFHLLSLCYMFRSSSISFFHNKYLVTLSDFKKVTNQCIDEKWIWDTFFRVFDTNAITCL